MIVEKLCGRLEYLDDQSKFRFIDAIECHGLNERDRIGQLIPALQAACGDSKQLLTLVDVVRKLLDESLSYERAHDPAEGRPFDLEHAHQIALHRRPRVRKL